MKLSSGGGKWLGWLLVVLFAWWALASPAEASAAVRHAGALLGRAAHGLGAFLGGLA